ncbi:uncharacterized protein LOC143033939 isoform X2 [Oratosquilla oratoria]|uniref:uncharacterized protein LOC143033939 isoform X2 n=1 Tax=Oratosquilla oratoria TaxID=337810 RepID=UPI003F777AB2
MRQLHHDTSTPPPPHLPPKPNGAKTPAPPPGTAPPPSTTGAPPSSAEEDLTTDMQRLGVKEAPRNGEGGGGTVTLPQEFTVKYLGRRDAGGLWGIKHTRRPVDEMVLEAKGLKSGETLPFLRMLVTEKGVTISETANNINKNFEGGFYPIDVISYGVQDLVYTRVFAMIVVREDSSSSSSSSGNGAVRNTSSLAAVHPFQCHAFVCDSRLNARMLTFALAQAFQLFSREVKNNKAKKPKRFAIDLRSPEEIEADLKIEDSEA